MQLTDTKLLGGLPFTSVGRPSHVKHISRNGSPVSVRAPAAKKDVSHVYSLHYFLPIVVNSEPRARLFFMVEEVLVFFLIYSLCPQVFVFISDKLY